VRHPYSGCSNQNSVGGHLVSRMSITPLTTTDGMPWTFLQKISRRCMICSFTISRIFTMWKIRRIFTNVENQIVKSLPILFEKATNRDLSRDLKDHLEATKTRANGLTRFLKNWVKTPGCKMPRNGRSNQRSRQTRRRSRGQRGFGVPRSWDQLNRSSIMKSRVTAHRLGRS
jgi:hypothetical protein